MNEEVLQFYTEKIHMKKKVLLFVNSCQISWNNLEDCRLLSWACDKTDS